MTPPAVRATRTSTDVRTPTAGGSPSGVLARAVAADARTELHAILADIRRWVDLDSPSAHGAQLDDLARDIAATAEAAGFAAELVDSPAGCHLHARLCGAGAVRVALLCHHDTVFPLGTAADRPFTLDGERLRGPGVADMKGGIAVALHAARLLARRSSAFAVIELMSVPDEEIRVVPPLTLDRIAGFDAVLCMECGRAAGAVVSERKGGLWARLEAEGIAAHAGVAPDDGRNAVLALCREALRIAELDRAREGLTVQISRLHGGDVVNSVPASATLDVDARAWTQRDLDWVADRIVAAGTHSGIEVAIGALDVVPPMPRATARPLVETAHLVGAELGIDIADTTTGGVSDACWTAAAGLPTLDGLGPVGGRDHSPDEYVETESLSSRCGLIAGLIHMLDRAE
jgi:glutamate carboxypeptidase